MKASVFFQGSEKLHGDAEVALKKMLDFCAKNDIEVKVGAKGNIVRIACESEALVDCHKWRDEPDQIQERAGVTVENYADGHGIAEWGKRLGALLLSDGAIFFPGRKGTIAHLCAFLAFAKEKWIALVNWSDEDFQALRQLFRLDDTDFSRVKRFALKDWRKAIEWASH